MAIWERKTHFRPHFPHIGASNASMRRFTASRRRYRLQILAGMGHERIAGGKRMAAVVHPHPLQCGAITRAGIKKQ